MNYKLIETIYQGGKITKYVLFKEMEADVKLRILYSNNMSNSEGKFKILEDLDVNQMMEKEEKSYWIRDYLLDVTVNKKPLFVAIG